MAAIAAAALLGPFTSAHADKKDRPSSVGKVSVFATGLQYPRGLRFGPDGNLYVAEAGEGPTTLTVPPDCESAGPAVAPYTASATGGRISKVDSTGQRTTVTDTFPRAVNGLGDTLGVADIEFMDGEMFALVASGGCSHAVTSIPSGIARVKKDGSWRMVADFSQYQRANPVATPELGDFEPDGTWYSMVAVRGALYAVEPNHGELVKVNRNGKVSRVIDFSASLGHVVPTAVAHHRGFYVGNLGEFDPGTINTQNVFHVTQSGALSVAVSGLSKVLSVAFDEDDRMYVLQMTVGQQFPTPGLGQIVRIEKHGLQKIVATGLSLPTAMTFGPDGNLYVSNWGFGPPFMGQILKVEVSDD